MWTHHLTLPSKDGIANEVEDLGLHGHEGLHGHGPAFGELHPLGTPTNLALFFFSSRISVQVERSSLSRWMALPRSPTSPLSMPGRMGLLKGQEGLADLVGCSPPSSR